jgi:beta-lactam-binding protein with PASTA domain/tRNA A-37 threonylcarbamoyl transferase component Bud32
VASSDDLVGTIVDGRYQIDAFIARGGMATVYRATDLRLDRTVALKVMHPHLATDPDFVSRFQREAKAAARLTHPHVVGVFDQGTEGEQVYLAMEYVKGRTLRDVLNEYGPLTPEQALVIVEPILEALNAAHAAGFVHRDIKPENILIADDGRVKVADFGLARALTTSDKSQTQGVIMGTVAYLAPEQVERGEADERTDIYATGVVFFEMITGAVPYTGDSPIAVAFQHVHSDVPTPSSIASGVPAEADALVVKATRRDPNLRYQHAREFLADTKRAKSQLPGPRPLVAMQDTLVVDAPQMTPRKSSAPATEPRRKRGGLIAALVFLAALVAAGIGGWYVAIGPGSQVPVPDVIALNLGAAQERLSADDLTAAVIDEVFSEDVEAGLVVQTDPPVGDGVRAGGEVGLIMSKGPERYEVPAVRGEDPDTAVSMLNAANLQVGSRSTVFDTKIPQGAVVGTAPKAGALVKADASIDLLISKGPEPVPVPNVIGARANAAKSTLSNAGLKSSTTQRFSNSVADGRVINVKPKVGAIVPAGTSVELIVSKGPPPVTVPNLIDMPRAKAVNTLRRLGLKVKVDAGSFTRLNRVIDQSPAAGSQVARGTTVTLKII